jgi:hypothetical protein
MRLQSVKSQTNYQYYINAKFVTCWNSGASCLNIVWSSQGHDACCQGISGRVGTMIFGFGQGPLVGGCDCKFWTS